MRLLSSSALWWLLLGVIIVFFYLLKLKRRRTVVPSVLLWKRALEEMEANAPFKKLRRSLLLLLQLLALAALVFTLARPLVVTRALASGSTVIVIDSTASMRARDEEAGSRLDRAKQLARDMIDSLSSSDRAAIIESSSRVSVRSPLTSDHAALASAINDIQETDAPGLLTDAVRLAQQISKSEHDASVVIISDGGSVISPETEAPVEPTRQIALPSREASVRFVRVGHRSDNVGIIALNSRQVSEGARREMFASIVNFGDHNRTLAAELKIEGKLVDARTIELGANERRALVFDSLPGEGGLAELKLDVEDDLASDNVAYAFLPSAHRVRVGFIGENPFLIEALAVNPDIDASRIGSIANSISSVFDCFVIEGAGATEANRPMLIINPQNAAGLWRTTGQRERPDITSVERSHPVNSFLSYGDVHIETIARREVAPWLKPIVSAGNDPVIWAGDDGHRRMVLIGFDLAQSDLPLKVEFPILLANSLSWLAGRDATSTERALRAGQTTTLQTVAPSAIITTPVGDTREVTARDGTVVFADTLRAGRYEVNGGAPFGVSLLSEAESNTAPRNAIATRAGEISGQPEAFYSEREAWRWIALFALAVLMIEWWAYHRRVT
jgi:VWA domain-containing protein/aerotolerance regulator-like protein